MKSMLGFLLAFAYAFGSTANAVPVEYFIDAWASGYYDYSVHALDSQGNPLLDAFGNPVFENRSESVNDQRLVIRMEADTQNIETQHTPAARGTAEQTLFTQTSFYRMSFFLPATEPVPGGPLNDTRFPYPLIAADSQYFSLQALNQGPDYINASDGQHANIGVHRQVSLCRDICGRNYPLVQFHVDHGLNAPSTYLDLRTAWEPSSSLEGIDVSYQFAVATTGPPNPQVPYGTLTIEQMRDATFTVAGVPEPGTWALTLAGLGLVGLWGRRRARSSLA